MSFESPETETLDIDSLDDVEDVVDLSDAYHRALDGVGAIDVVQNDKVRIQLTDGFMTPDQAEQLCALIKDAADESRRRASRQTKTRGNR